MLQEYEYTGKAMGTDFSIAVVCHERTLADTVAKKASEKIQSYELQFSRFLEESELSVLNHKKIAHVSSNFIQVIKKAHELFTKTKGIFNPLVQIERFGYAKNFDELHQAELDEYTDSYDIDFASTIIDEAEMQVTLMDGQRLDFGGFLKGYLAELLAKEIMQHSPLIIGVIINIGGDIHTQGCDGTGSPFTFTIYNPVTQKEDITVTLQDTSIATSGTYKRSWSHGSKHMHHILDVTGTINPPTNIVSASVIHKDGGVAEAYAKVFLSLGPERSAYILKNELPSYVLITREGKIITNTL